MKKDSSMQLFHIYGQMNFIQKKTNVGTEKKHRKAQVGHQVQTFLM